MTYLWFSDTIAFAIAPPTESESKKMPDISEDLRIIALEPDPKVREKLTEFLYQRDKVEGDPNFEQVLSSLSEGERALVNVLSLPIIWLVRPRRESQFKEALNILTKKIAELPN